MAALLTPPSASCGPEDVFWYDGGHLTLLLMLLLLLRLEVAHCSCAGMHTLFALLHTDAATHRLPLW
jgi:hypothetical protein